MEASQSATCSIPNVIVVDTCTFNVNCVMCLFLDVILIIPRICVYEFDCVCVYVMYSCVMSVYVTGQV